MRSAIFSILVKFLCCKKIVTTLIALIAEALKKEHPNKKKYWQNELKSLGIEPRRQNELNDKDELGALAEIIKSVLPRLENGIWYNSNQDNDNKKKKYYKLHFDHLI